MQILVAHNTPTKYFRNHFLEIVRILGTTNWFIYCHYRTLQLHWAYRMIMDFLVDPT